MYRHLEALIFPTTLITVLSDHGEPFCPKCEEPFWPKDVHIHYEVEDIITSCQEMLEKFKQWESGSVSQDGNTAEPSSMDSLPNPLEEDEDSYVTASNQSPPNVRSVIEIGSSIASSNKTLNLGPIEPELSNDICSIFDDDSIEGVDTSVNEVNEQEVIKLDLPTTPSEEKSQKSLHNRPVKRTYSLRRKSKEKAPLAPNDQVSDWLDRLGQDVSVQEDKDKRKVDSMCSLSKTPSKSDETKSRKSSTQSTDDFKTPLRKKRMTSSSSKTPSSTPRSKCNKNGETPLHIAAKTGNIESLEQLIESGEWDINSRDNYGWTPLHEACINAKSGCANILITHGADVNARAQNLDTPLHDASAKLHIDIVDLLLQHGARTNVKNIDGLLPADLVLPGSSKSISLIKMLDKFQVNNNQVNSAIFIADQCPVIAFSGIYGQDQARFSKVLDFQVSEDMGDHVTHLVCAEDATKSCKRTIKFIKAMALGIPIVRSAWLEESARKRQFVSFSDHFVPCATGHNPGAPKQCFMDHTTKSPGLFTGLTFFVDRRLKGKPGLDRNAISELISLANGKLIQRMPKQPETPRGKVYHASESSILHSSPTIVIDSPTKPGLFPVRQYEWLLKCICNYRLSDD